MESRAFPAYFFLDDQLHKYIKTVLSDDSVVAWNYPEESRVWLPRKYARREFKKAFSIAQAAKLMNIKPGRIRELIDRNHVNVPARTYDLSSYAPGKVYFSEDDMLDLRQAAWDVLPKNRFGEPYNDTMTNETELIHRMSLLDDREFRYDEEDGLQQIYRAV